MTSAGKDVFEAVEAEVLGEIDEDADLTPPPDGELLIRTPEEVRAAQLFVGLIQKSLGRAHYLCKPFIPGFSPSESRQVLKIQESIDGVLELADKLQAQLTGDLGDIDQH